MYKFSYDKYVKDCEENLMDILTYLKEYDGEKVELYDGFIGSINDNLIHIDWCERVEDNDK